MMPKLVLKFKGKTIQEYDLSEASDKFVIGSEYGPLFINDRDVSPSHIEFEISHPYYYITDLDSATGTFVNEISIEGKQKVPLNYNDQILLGNHTLILSSSKIKSNYQQAPASQVENFNLDHPGFDEETRKLDFSFDKTSIDKPTEPPTQVNVPLYGLECVAGPYKGSRFHLKPDTTKIGRQEDNDIIICNTKQGIVDKSISRHHAVIFVKNGRYFISDQNSQTGTILNNRRLPENVEKELKEGDKIEIASNYANTVFRFVSLEKSNHPSSKKGISKTGQIQFVFAILISLIVVILAFIIYNDSDNSNFTDQPLIDNIVLKHKLWQPRSWFGESYRIRPQQRYAMVPTPAIADVNHDGSNDLLIIDSSGYLHLLDLASKTPIWSTIRSGESSTDYSVTLTDLNNDANFEVLISGRDSRIYAFDGKSGGLLWQSDLLGGRLASQPTIGDLNKDGVKDIIVCSQEGNIYIGLSNNIRSYNWIKHPTEHNTLGIPVAIGLDSDRRDKIVLGTVDGYFHIFDYTAPKFTSKSHQINSELDNELGKFGENNSINNAIASGQHREKSKGAISVIFSRQYRVLAYQPQGFHLLWIDILTDRFSSLPREYASPVLTDLNYDSFLDVVVASHNGIVRAYSGKEGKNLKPIVLWSFKDEGAKCFLASPALADLSGDGIADVVIADTSGTLFILDGSKGTPLARSTDIRKTTTASPLMADGDGDGNMDIYLVDNLYNIHEFGTNIAVPPNTLFWNQYLGSEKHSANMVLNRYEKTSISWKRILAAILILGLLVFWIVYIRSSKKRELQWA